MTGLEIALVIVGVIFIAGSFLVSEKLSASDIKEIQQMGEKEVRLILEKELNAAESKIEDALEVQLEESVAKLETQSDKETNDKIMAISEYSDTVLDAMNKSHNEVMFMYSMLNDKQEALTQMTKDMQQMESELLALKEQIDVSPEIVANIEAQMPQEVVTEAPSMIEELQEHIQQEQVSDSEQANVNDQILQLHQQGMSQIEIAKKLGKGLGEVKLVLGLFEGEA